MEYGTVILVITICWAGVHSIDLIQPESKVLQPGQTLTITCRVSGYSLTDGSYATGWIRQREGKGLDWIFTMWHDGSLAQDNALKNKFSGSRDTSAATLTITGQNLQPEDTAVYYCARLIEDVLGTSSGGEEVLQEYHTTQTLTDATRRKLVNIIVAHMIDKHGQLPSKAVREEYALGIVTVFPSLKDPYSKNGNEHFYDAASSTGYISWRLKTIQRKIRRGHASTSSPTGFSPGGGCPNVRRSIVVDQQLDGDAYQEAISLLNHTTDSSVIFLKMRETFQNRQKLIHDSDKTQKNLLSRIYGFDYGFLERKNRPTKIVLDSAGNGISLNSIQTFCLVKNIPLLFGDIVPAENRHWSLLLLLLKIMNIVFSPSLTLGMTVYLKNVILDHHKLFKCLYPHRKLIPKHHFMIHYPSSIRKIGPLLYVWCMRYEAKHKMFKDYFKNFKNKTKSLAKRHQMAIAYHWETFTLKQKEYGPMKSFSLRDENVVNSEMCEMLLSKDVFSTSWVKVDGVEYKGGLVVCSSMEEDMPVFCQIDDVLLVEDDVYFLTKKLFTEMFVEHHHAFKVLPTEERCVMKMTELKCHQPFDIQSSYGKADESLYIIPSFIMF
ncbi:uncharacterized protein PAE49_023617 [Odontesthes bonariensis]|uniref:uncharacterized protein LOC142371832 n=1 Tax=Odontesthes bonariensis TaxID=219752 RepID=UPI003F585B98